MSECRVALAVSETGFRLLVGAQRCRWRNCREREHMSGRMTMHLSEAVAEKIGHAESLYHRLVLVVGTDGLAKVPAFGTAPADT